ncbi:MAG: PleD family two-component system response regulator [Methylacidiphilales bacterium]|nr:PleD family two-component system response regulator [Candidatus Methylacidiphilales bacterium]
MTARVLVVDDVPTNVRLLEARLSAEYFEVLTAASGAEALDICGQAQCDIVLLDVMMPGMDGFEVCRRLKANPLTYHIPVIMITALSQAADRVKGLEAGADDFLTKPVDDIALLTRVRSLVRLKMALDELRLRAVSTRDIGIADPLAEAVIETGLGGRVLVVDDKLPSIERIAAALRHEQTVETASDVQQALFRAAEGNFDLVMVSLGLEGADGLRLCGQLRSLDRTRHVPLLLLVEPEDNDRLLRALDLGVNDYLVRPIDRQELLARVRTQVRKRRYANRLRDNVQHSMELAISDALTGLHNRRYLESHLGAVVDQAAVRWKPVSLLILDIDHFKSVNDTWGHDAGDDVLREFALRLKRSIRGIDLACRFGGEEFVVVMPETDLAAAKAVAERIRRQIAAEPFAIQKGTRQLDVTISIGLATRQGPADMPEAILKRADEALYRAKRGGRNRVVADAA